MRKPMSPPPFQRLVQDHAAGIGEIISANIGATVNGRYLHWDQVRHRAAPVPLTLEQWWFGIKLARLSLGRSLPLIDPQERPFSVAVTSHMQAVLHEIDSLTAGRIAMPEAVTAADTRERFLFRSLLEEAITSSQLEGATTTRRQAMEMFRSGREPANKIISISTILKTASTQYGHSYLYTETDDNE